MKYKVTKKEIRESGNKVYCVGYCNLQFLLNFHEPFAYSTRAEGWACDYYLINDIIISTGYAPIGRKTDYSLCREYDKKAEKVRGDYNLTWEQQKETIEALLIEFVEKLTHTKKK